MSKASRNVSAFAKEVFNCERIQYFYPFTVLSDPKANAYITTVGYQWDGLSSVSFTRKDFPDKRIMQTETECGNWYWRAGFNPNKPQNDWNYGVYTWRKARSYFTKGVNSYMLWNMVLDQEGKSIDSKRPWPQNAAIVVDTNTKSVIYTPMYYAFKHFSYFVKPGAHLIGVSVTGDEAIAFKNPDGSIVLVLQNANNEEKPLTIKLNEKALALSLPPQSWGTLIIPDAK